jgi:hypothetical protein
MMTMLISEEQAAGLAVAAFVLLWLALFAVALALERRKRKKLLAETCWIVRRGGRDNRAATPEELREWVASGSLVASDSVWSPALKQWRPAPSLPEIADLFPAVITRPQTNEGIGCLVVGALVVGLLVWGYYTFLYAPSHPATASPNGITYVATDRAETALVAQLADSLPDQQPRVVKLAGGNVDVFLNQGELEREIAYPDRAELFKRVGVAWCSNVQHTYLPRIRFRNVQNGREFGSYACVSESIGLPNN